MIEKMPEEYKGEITHNANKSDKQARKWTEKEIEWVKRLLQKGYTKQQIAQSIDRGIIATKIKIKLLSKDDYTYNTQHILEKYRLNRLFLEEIKPKTILDLYAGLKSYYKKYNAITNDINEKADTIYHLDAFKLICKLYSENNKYDLIDLDPFGSAYDTFDIAIKMANKGLIITLGELGHKRWKRLDFVSRYYNIYKLEDYTIENIIKEIQKIGLRNKKQLIVWNYKEWQNTGRVYFIIKKGK